MLCSLRNLCSEIKARSMLWLSSSLLKLPADDIMPLTFHVKMLQKGVVIIRRTDMARLNEYSFILKVLVDSFIFIAIIIIFIIVVSVVRPGRPLLFP